MLWRTRDIAILVGVAALAAALGGYLGYEIARTPSPVIINCTSTARTGASCR